MQNPRFHPLTAFRHLRGLSQRLLPWMLVAMLVAGIGHASHLHKPDAARGGDALHCGLCLQFDRLASTPSAPQLVAPPKVVSWVALPADLARPAALLLHLYEARGPPRVS
ncbi:MAG: DUF2946 family protein [Steroidobacteraceae bacterium]